MWPKRILGPWVTSAMSFTRRAVPVWVFKTVCSMSCTLLKSPSARTFICCIPSSTKLPPALILLLASCCSTWPMLNP